MYFNREFVAIGGLTSFATVVDPVGAGFVDSLAQLGGNATGFTTFEYGIGVKWLELLKEIAPGATRRGGPSGRSLPERVRTARRYPVCESGCGTFETCRTLR